eukprot:GFUD01030855.1.p1 GENE.GFUD01030855.1~~GFUD01030855.1.p1  ORF type:complete len:207 (+),score=47.72 GFUD01030855.1:52-672(+)
MKLLALLCILFSVCECQNEGGGMSSDFKALIVVFVIVLAGVAIWGIMCFRNDGSYQGDCSCGSDDEDEVEERGSALCYLCHRKVPNSEWNSGQHRTECARTNSEVLQAMKTSHIRCKQCREQLRLWPRMGVEFECNNNYNCRGNSNGKGIVNTGINRFNCFQCNIDFCLPCIEESEATTYPANVETEKKWNMENGKWRCSGLSILE